MSVYDYEKLCSLPTKEKITYFEKNDKIIHVILADQFNREIMEFLCNLATTMRRIAKSTDGVKFLQTLLSHKSAMLYFTQPSTRTYLSFVRACQYLGIVYAEVRDPRISSAIKGESDIDGVRTFSSYFDLIIMRHHEGGFAEKVAFMMNDINRPIPVISGGAGADEHPTQALLDVYTLKRSFESRPDGINNIHIAFVGDIARGRTVRSLAKLLTNYENVEMTFVSPKELALRDDVKAYLKRVGAKFNEITDLREVIPVADAIYMTRIQDEYDVQGESRGIDYRPFHLRFEDVQKMKHDAVIMHPLPRRQELDQRIDKDHRAMYWRQERNGMWIRAALMAYLLNVESKILDYYIHYYNVDGPDTEVIEGKKQQ